MREFARVTRRSIFIVVEAGNGVAGREWWEERLFTHGLRRHPLMQRVTHFTALGNESGHMCLVMEKCPGSGTPGFATDQLRMSNPGSDAAIARYTLACDLVRAGDVVLDAMSGSGFGAAILACGAEAGRVIGVDPADASIVYASAHYSAGGCPTAFHRGGPAAMDFLPDSSVDFVTCFDLTDGVSDPAAMLREIERVLTPGGRVMVGIREQAAQSGAKTGRATSLESLRTMVGERFLLEKRWRQRERGATGQVESAANPPAAMLSVVPMEGPPEGGSSARSALDTSGEWHLIAAMKSPVAATKAGYQERMFPDATALDGYNLYAFERDYDNPYLFRSMICIGPRMSDAAQLEVIARGVLASARAGTADHGAAVCVLAYRALEEEDTARRDEAMSLIAAFESQTGGPATSITAHAWRWRISNQYVAAKLLLARGDREGAKEAFVKCARMDVMAFSPLLATKTVDAWCQAGILSALSGDVESARAEWVGGMQEARRVVQGSWVNVWGRPEEPQPYGLHELAQVMDAASACAGWHSASLRLANQPGTAWVLAHRQTFGDTRQFVKQLVQAKAWLEGQVAAAQAEREALVQSGSLDQTAMFDRLSAYVRSADGNGDLATARAWLEGQIANWKWEHDLQVGQYREVRAHAVWLEGQVESWKREHETQVAHTEELRAHTARLANQVEAWQREHGSAAEQANELRGHAAWLEGQAANWKRECDLQSERNTELEKSVQCLEGQVANWKREHEIQLKSTDELRLHVSELDIGRRWLEDQLLAARTHARRVVDDSKRFEESSNSHIRWLEGQIENWKNEAARCHKAVDELRAHIAELEKARLWLEEQLRLHKQHAAEKISLLSAQLDSALRESEKRGATADELREKVRQLGAANAVQRAEIETFWTRVKGLLDELDRLRTRGLISRILNRASPDTPA